MEFEWWQFLMYPGNDRTCHSVSLYAFYKFPQPHEITHSEKLMNLVEKNVVKQKRSLGLLA